MTTQSRRKSSTGKTQQPEPTIENNFTVSKVEEKKSEDEFVVVPALDYKKLLASLDMFMKKEAANGNKSEDDKIQPGETIEVISLSPGIVNATTAGGDNNGRVYTFREFGASMKIPYNDLVNIVQNHYKFFERGYLYVNDARFTKINGLEQITKNVLNKEQIEKLVHGGSSEDLDLFAHATGVQKEHIVGMLIDDINDGKNVDMNRIYAISNFVGYDIGDRARQVKQMFEKPE